MVINKVLVAVFFSSFFACGESDVEITQPEEVIELTAGDYVGTWNSTTELKSFSNVPVSAKISEGQDGKWSGTFYISNNFTSCCGSGSNDGTITFTLKEELQIVDFVWNDIIPNCEGTFTGSGRLPKKDRFTIQFTGTDCDGTHTGNMTLSKVE